MNGNLIGANGQRKKLGKDEGKREIGARRKGDGMAEFETERKKAAEELRERIQTQERELRAKQEKEALEREWELARKRGVGRNIEVVRFKPLQTKTHWSINKVIMFSNYLKS